MSLPRNQEVRTAFTEQLVKFENAISELNKHLQEQRFLRDATGAVNKNKVIENIQAAIGVLERAITELSTAQESSHSDANRALTQLQTIKNRVNTEILAIVQKMQAEKKQAATAAVKPAATQSNKPQLKPQQYYQEIWNDYLDVRSKLKDQTAIQRLDTAARNIERKGTTVSTYTAQFDLLKNEIHGIRREFRQQRQQHFNQFKSKQVEVRPSSMQSLQQTSRQAERESFDKQAALLLGHVAELRKALTDYLQKKPTRQENAKRLMSSVNHWEADIKTLQTAISEIKTLEKSNEVEADLKKLMDSMAKEITKEKAQLKGHLFSGRFTQILNTAQNNVNDAKQAFEKSPEQRERIRPK